MRRMDSLDTSNNQIIFKKRKHRPWETSSLEGALESSLMPALEESRASLKEEVDLLSSGNYHPPGDYHPSSDYQSSGDYHHSREFQAEFTRALQEDTLREQMFKDEVQSHSGSQDYNSMNSQYLESELQKIMGEKAKERLEVSELIKEDENRIMIGGFLNANKMFSGDEEKREENHSLMDELTHKDDEIQMLTKILEAAKASEQVEQLEMNRQKEEGARKTAEEKAMQALRQAKLANEQARKAEQRAQMEHVFRAGEKGSRQLLEEKLKTAMYALKNKEEALQKEEQAKRHAEQKIKEALQYAAAAEKKIKMEADKKISEVLQQASEYALKSKDDFQRKEELHKREAESKIKEALQYATNVEHKIKAEADKRMRDLLQQASENETKVRREADDQVREILQATMKTENKIQREADERIKLLEEQLEARTRDIEAKAQKIAIDKIRYIEDLAENKLKENVEKANRAAFERVRLTEEQAEARIEEVEERSAHFVKEMEKKTQEKIAEIQNFAERAILDARDEADQRVKSIQNQLVAFERAKENAEMSEQKLYEDTRKAEIAKLEIETKFEVAIQKHVEEKTEYERRIEILQRQHTILQEQKIIAENESVMSVNQLSAALENLQKLETVVQTERNLRKILEEKLYDMQRKEKEEIKRVTEEKTMELMQRIEDMKRIQTKFEKPKKVKKSPLTEEIKDTLEAIIETQEKVEAPALPTEQRTGWLKNLFGSKENKKESDKAPSVEPAAADISPTAAMEIRNFQGF